jgi:tryptophan synthase beta chain
MIVREFQAVIGRETREQILEKEGALPDAVAACVGGGSNALGIFAAFLEDASVRLFGVEAAGKGLHSRHQAASILTGRTGVLHGAMTKLLDDEDGQIRPAHSIAAGLDYPAVGPEHAWLAETGRVKYLSATDDEALTAFEKLSRTEGIIPALEPAHALARLPEVAAEIPKGGILVVCLSGRGDKDAEMVEEELRQRVALEEDAGEDGAAGLGGAL